MDAAVYARISKDDEGDGLGVERQLEDCKREAKRRGWQIAREYIDNDRSASNGRPRPEFVRMMSEVDAGHVAAVVVWDADRLTRQPLEVERIISAHEKHGLQLANCGGDMDLSTVDGRVMFRIKGAMSKAEVERSSRRIKRSNDQRAQQGKPHGRVAFGYRRVDGRDVLDVEQADVVREAARRLLAGESLRSVGAALNEQGSVSPSGKPWMSTTLRQVLLRDRNAGIRAHRIDKTHAYRPTSSFKGDWEPIYDETTHRRVVALLRDPSRRTNKGRTQRHLLSGIATCGLCEGEMRVVSSHTAGGKTMPPRYQCRTCFKVARKQSAVDEYVEGVMIERLSRADAIVELATGRPERAAELRDLIDDASAQLDLIADDFADGKATGDQLRRVNAKLMPKIEQWRHELAACAPINGLTALTGPDAAELWVDASLDVKRSAIKTLITVMILPSGPGKKFDRSLILVEPAERV